jgi:hypothetical protein
MERGGREGLIPNSLDTRLVEALRLAERDAFLAAHQVVVEGSTVEETTATGAGLGQADRGGRAGRFGAKVSVEDGGVV